MGNECMNECLNQSDFSHEQKSLVVITLNYGGVLKNPFEFYSDDEENEKKLSETFRKLLPLYVSGFNASTFDWEVGKIDLKFQSERYSPLYNSKVGVTKQNKLINGKEFLKEWETHYHDFTKHTKIDPEPKKTEKENMKTFDLICYHTILDHLYPLDQNKTLMSIDVSKLDAEKYKEFMKIKFSKSFLDENLKLEKVIQKLRNVDVAFIQEASELLIRRLEKEKSFKIKSKGNENSMIVLREEKFLNEKKELNLETIEQMEKLNFKGNNKIVYFCVNKLIMICAHLSSKKEKNQEEMKDLIDFFNQFSKKNKGYEIIFGADANGYIDREKLPKALSVFPGSASMITTRKKRTLLQPQLKKANQVVEECKDHIVTTLRMKSPSIQTIDEKDAKEGHFLPSNDHPFDHFMVKCELSYH